MNYIAKTFFGLEPLLEKELQDLGAKDIQRMNRAVSFSGNLELLYKANFHCRTALRILKTIHTFRANNENSLYKGVKDFDWAQWFQPGQTFAIDKVVNSQYFKHSQYAALKTKDAIVDRFRDKTGKRPWVYTKDPDLLIHLHIQHDKVSLAFDSSGGSLHKRGYRQSAHPAPVNEVLAAGLLQLTGFDGTNPFYDPMCGSGTFLVEAAMIARRIAPGSLRSRFGFEQWKDFDPDIWSNIKKMAEAQIVPLNIPITGSDISGESTQLARECLTNANLEGVTVSKGSFFDKEARHDGGIIILNPPYGERMGEEDLGPLYKKIGDHLKNACKGNDAWILSSNKDAMKNVGLRTFKKFTVYNGALECKFHGFKLF